MAEIKLHKSWLKHLEGEFKADYMIQLKKFLKSEYDAKKIIYPKASEYFNALEHTHLNNVKVVLLGQDPYHGPGQAHGLCFSVREGVRFPPSLMNIFKELKTDVGAEIPKSGDLTRWADQGVLMLNSVLTVEAGMAGSHQKKGWEQFTDAVIKCVSDEKKNVVFMLWGRYAQDKGSVIDAAGHYILKSKHPSPMSANGGGWFGNHHFSKANAYLESKGLQPINW